MADKGTNMTRPPSKLLTVQVIIGLNTIGYLLEKDRAARDGGAGLGGAYTSASEIAASFGLALSQVQHAIAPLAAAGILNAAKGKYGGFSLVEGALKRFTIVDAIEALGQQIPPPSGGDRPSDRITDAIYDILDVPLEDFFA